MNRRLGNDEKIYDEFDTEINKQVKFARWFVVFVLVVILAFWCFLGWILVKVLQHFDIVFAVLHA